MRIVRLNEAEKNEVSHRARAAEKMREIMRQICSGSLPASSGREQRGERRGPA